MSIFNFFQYTYNCQRQLFKSCVYLFLAVLAFVHCSARNRALLFTGRLSHTNLFMLLSHLTETQGRGLGRGSISSAGYNINIL